MRWRWQNRQSRAAAQQNLGACAMTADASGNGHSPLTTLRPGSRAEVCGVHAGCKARCRLAALGLIPGSVLQVVANPGLGPLLLSVGESRLMVERGVASKVQVQSL